MFVVRLFGRANLLVSRFAFLASICLIAFSDLSATESWSFKQLSMVEEVYKKLDAERDAMRSFNPGWKEFKTFYDRDINADSTKKISVPMKGIRKIWLGSSGREMVFLANPQWVDGKGKKTPVVFSDKARKGGNANRIRTHKAGSKKWQPGRVVKNTYDHGIMFSEAQIEVDVPEGTVALECDIGAEKNPRWGTLTFFAELESRYNKRYLSDQASHDIRIKIDGDYDTPLDICEQWMERRDKIWYRNLLSCRSDRIMGAYVNAAPDELKERAKKIKGATPENLLAARSLYYLGKARERIDLCRKTIEFVADAGASIPWAKPEVDKLENKIKKVLSDLSHPTSNIPHSTKEMDGHALFADAFKLRRKILFSHPDLAFDDLFVNINPPTMYSHNCDQYLGRHSRIGDGPTILSNWKSDNLKKTHIIRDKMPAGAFHRPRLHPDGNRFVFAYADHTPEDFRFRRYFLYEASIDGSSIRQLTGTERDGMKTWMGRETVMIEDNDPNYLPDGGIVFVSTRCQCFGRCHGSRYTPSLLLYRCDGNGDNIRQLSYASENETTPTVLNDGRIVYTRWEYIDRHEMEFHKLWWKRPDGTGASNYYGNDTIYPLMISEVSRIPDTHKIIATAMAHHSFHSGTMIMIDVMKGENGDAPVTRLTPEIKYPESNEGGFNTGGHFCSPHAISEELWLATYSPENVFPQGTVPDANGNGVILVDPIGGREPIFREADMSTFNPVPLIKTKMPPVLPTVLPEQSEDNTGIYVIQDVNHTRNDPDGILKPGQIKYLRFNEIYPKPTVMNASINCRVGVGQAKRIIGTVPVGADGSVVVRAPAHIPIQIQALDENGMAVMTERSFHYLQPGERRGCVGCHAEAGSAPYRNAALLDRKPLELTPPAGPKYPGGFSFMKTVQPVIDRYCIRCHGLDTKNIPNGVNLIGVQRGSFSQSYLTLARFTNPIGLKRETHGLEKNISRPKDYYAHGSVLGKMLLHNHKKVNLPREDFQRIVNWLDLNTQSNGDSSHNRDEHASIDHDAEKVLFEAVKQRFGDQFAGQRYYELVNYANPDESRILMAPLPETAGGWGQISKGAWSSKDDPEFKRFAGLVKATIKKLPPDIHYTCGRDDACRCGSCWVRTTGVNKVPLKKEFRHTKLK